MVQEMNVSCHVRTEIVQSVADRTHLRRQMVLSRETAESSLWKSKHKGQSAKDDTWVIRGCTNKMETWR